MNTAILHTSAKELEIEQQAIKKFTPLVKRIARHMMEKLPTSIQIDDLIQAGMVGLAEANKRYKGEYGHQFELFAAQRIRVSILKQLRIADSPI
ncbi:MAG: hypothetical protein CMH70_09270 [Nitrosomonadaceae bacterium]|nr:hypothetical protein [Nitrosomonadaceae bacterium]|tara:strand:- start:96 stop:377 length:282 start_codon:yes stop_codon:yes gene_type:complete